MMKKLWSASGGSAARLISGWHLIYKYQHKQNMQCLFVIHLLSVHFFFLFCSLPDTLCYNCSCQKFMSVLRLTSLLFILKIISECIEDSDYCLRTCILFRYKTRKHTKWNTLFPFGIHI
jgi:hypothetical protein